jgi:hypothetical protein
MIIIGGGPGSAVDGRPYIIAHDTTIRGVAHRPSQGGGPAATEPDPHATPVWGGQGWCWRWGCVGSLVYVSPGAPLLICTDRANRAFRFRGWSSPAPRGDQCDLLRRPVAVPLRAASLGEQQLIEFGLVPPPTPGDSPSMAARVARARGAAVVGDALRGPGAPLLGRLWGRRAHRGDQHALERLTSSTGRHAPDGTTIQSISSARDHWLSQ